MSASLSIEDADQIPAVVCAQVCAEKLRRAGGGRPAPRRPRQPRDEVIDLARSPSGLTLSLRR